MDDIYAPDGPFWPWPGQPVPHLVLPELPPARFAEGDRVRTRWGTAIVLTVHPWALFGHRAYHVRHGWCSSPPGFGHTFSEDDMELLERAAAIHAPEVFQEPAAPVKRVEQLALFQDLQ